MPNILTALRSIRRAFQDEEVAAPTRSRRRREQAMTLLSEQAGRELFSLVDSGKITALELPDHLRERPLMPKDIQCLDDVGMEIEIYDTYWLAFLGWAAEQVGLPITTTEDHTSDVHELYRPGLERQFGLDAPDRHDDEGTPWSDIGRTSIEAIDYLIDRAETGRETKKSEEDLDSLETDHRHRPAATGMHGEPTSGQRKAYRAYQLAEQQAWHVQMTDRKAYEWLEMHPEVLEAVDGYENYELPSFDTWSRYVRACRRAYGDQKNHPRGGRMGRSIVKSSQIERKTDSLVGF